MLDADGLAVNAQPYSLDATGVGSAVEVAERIAKATRLRNMTSTLAQGAGLTGTVTVQLATHHDGRRTARDSAGERLYLEDRVSVTITNATDRTMFVAVFDVTPGYEVVMLNTDEPSGWKLAPREVRTVGGDAGVPLVVEQERAHGRVAVGVDRRHRRDRAAGVRPPPDRRRDDARQRAVGARSDARRGPLRDSATSWPPMSTTRHPRWRTR